MTDYVKTLQNAREQMVKARREVAEELARPYSDTPRSRTIFIEIQTLIEQIDKAIAEELTAVPCSLVMTTVSPFSHEKSLGDSARVNVRCGLNLRVNDINLH